MATSKSIIHSGFSNKIDRRTRRFSLIFFFALLAKSSFAWEPLFLDGKESLFPETAETVGPRKWGPVSVFQKPGGGQRRGTLAPEARLRVYSILNAPETTGAKEESCKEGKCSKERCYSPWFEVGPYAWVCGDELSFFRDKPTSRKLPPALPFDYYFVREEVCYTYKTPQASEFDSPLSELQKGFAIAISETILFKGERWGKTSHNEWVNTSVLSKANPSDFHGERVEQGIISKAWVRKDSTLFEKPKSSSKKFATKKFQDVVTIDASLGAQAGFTPIILSIEEKAWIRTEDLILPKKVARPALASHKWIHVDTKSQTLVAYQGDTPVYATLISSGRPGFATPRGLFQIWVKLFSTAMDNLEDPNAGQYYSMDNVPWVQFFNKGVALHGVFWHHQFGHVQSHGCINLSPKDAAWLFEFTEPRVLAGFEALLPSTSEGGTSVWVD